MSRPVDPAVLREAVGRVAMIAAAVPVGPDPSPSWVGEAERAHRVALEGLGGFTRAMTSDLGLAVSLLRRLAESADTVSTALDAWASSVREAEQALAVAIATADAATIASRTTELDRVRRRSVVATTALLESLALEDRRVAQQLDTLLVRCPTTDIGSLIAVVGAVDGGPGDLVAELAIAFQSSRLAMRTEAEGPLADQIARLEMVRIYLRRLGIRAVDFGLLSALRRHRRRLLEWNTSDRQFLLYDADGDGRIVEVIGDLGSASHVAVLVPGITTTEFSFDEDLRPVAVGLRGGSPDVAVVAWLGYDTPGAGPLGNIPITFGALGGGLAREGAEELVRFVEWLRARRPDVHMSVIAHSYGSVVAAIAAAEGLGVDDLVLVGSPGSPVADVTGFDLAPGARVWAGQAPWDPIDELSSLVAFGGSPDDDGDPLRLVHGINPMHAAFGATELDFAGSFGHSGYFDEHGLVVLSGIVVGAGPGVTTAGAGLLRPGAQAHPERSSR